ncbi:hypothetical protein ACH0BF_16295 [Pseudobacillus sp. 179-B 2D1 NHS]|uniref:hypothetical protein n=1 Tax=Pseudobacillus sp. 179-B 2D1 NHS TaxID=3374292 RepID=UPI00387994AD
MIDKFLGMVILFLILGGPLIFPLLTKKWVWFITALIGYVAYAMWGIYLHFTSDIKEYGTDYGMLIFPYLMGVTLIGFTLQLLKSKPQKRSK